MASSSTSVPWSRMSTPARTLILQPSAPQGAGVAAFEADPGVRDGADGGLLDRAFQVEVGEVAHVAVTEVQVRLDEPRQEGLARGVDHAGPRRGRGRFRHPPHPAENL